MTETKNKEIERKKFYNLRKQTIKDVESKILEQVICFLRDYSNLDDKKEKYIGLYWPLGSEINLLSIRKLITSPIALPACNKNHELCYHSWRKKALIKDQCGIPSPINQPIIKPTKISVLLVPALAIDQRGIRLGYGGGYYDRLRTNKEWLKVPSYVVIPKICFTHELLPNDTWDIPFDGCITEDGFRRLI